MEDINLKSIKVEEIFSFKINLKSDAYKKKSLCRTCLSSLEDIKYDIFSNLHLKKFLSNCTSQEANENDGLPRYLCVDCHTKVIEFYNFREMCLTSFQKYYEYIKNLNNVNDNIGKGGDAIDKDCHIKIKQEKSSNYLDAKVVVDDNKSINQQNCSVDDDNDDQKNEKSNNKTNVKRNNKVKKGINKINKNFESISGLDIDEHLNQDKSSQSSKKIFTCKICDKRFYKVGKYLACLMKHKGKKPWHCPECEKVFRKKQSLLIHMKFVHRNCDMLIMCKWEGCNKLYKTEHTMKIHYKRIHCTKTNKTKMENDSKMEKSYICEFCGKSFKLLHLLNVSQIFCHTGEFPYKCESCGKCFSKGHLLKIHMKRHQGIKNYECTICGLKKVSKQELNIHMNFHTKIKQFSCKYCEYVSANIGNVIRHERIVHHGIKNFECKYCGKTFGKSETLKHHVMTHTGEKPHACHICDKRFIQKAALKIHIKSHENKNKYVKSIKENTKTVSVK